ncbi:SesA protein [Bisporella sp. PMI_857]|nr:SesA protein [Bisporella sp. PMI_857]
MSGIEVIGLISAVIGIIEGVSKLYNAIENTSHLPKAFREVARRLQLVRVTLQATEGRLQKHNVDGNSYTAIMPTVESCKDKAERLRNILQDMVAQPDASRVEHYRVVVRRLGKESKVEELMKGMLEDVQLLATNQAVKAVGEENIDELMRAIQALSQVPPTATDGSTFTYHGTGDQINNTGSGTQNINKGKGQQHIAHSISASD